MSTILKDTQAKVIGFVIVLVILLGCLVSWYTSDSKLVKAEKNVAVQSGVIKSQKEEIRVVGVVTKVNEEVVTKRETAKAVMEKKHVVIQEKLDKITREIEQKFDALPVTEDNIIAKQDEVSSARIDSLWETYCSGVQDETVCPAPPSTGETKS
jgi:hypothetical protein